MRDLGLFVLFLIALVVFGAFLFTLRDTIWERFLIQVQVAVAVFIFEWRKRSRIHWMALLLSLCCLLSFTLTTHDIAFFRGFWGELASDLTAIFLVGLFIRGKYDQPESPQALMCEGGTAEKNV